MSKPFQITSPSDPGIGRDPATGLFISSRDGAAPPQVVRRSSDQGVPVSETIEAARAPHRTIPWPAVVPPLKPFRLV